MFGLLTTELSQVDVDPSTKFTTMLVLLGVYFLLAFLPGWIALSRGCKSVAGWAFIVLFLLPILGVVAFLLLSPAAESASTGSHEAAAIVGASGATIIAALLIIFGWPALWLAFLIVAFLAKPPRKVQPALRRQPVFRPPLQRPTAPVVVCGGCGNSSPWGSRFCASCGQPIDYSSLRDG